MSKLTFIAVAQTLSDSSDLERVSVSCKVYPFYSSTLLGLIVKKIYIYLLFEKHDPIQTVLLYAFNTSRQLF